MTSNFSLGGGTAVIYSQSARARLAVVDLRRQTVDVVTRANGRMVHEEISLADLVEIADPDGTTWTRRGLGI